MADVYERAIALLNDAQSKVKEAQTQLAEANVDTGGVESVQDELTDAIEEIQDFRDEAEEDEKEDV